VTITIVYSYIQARRGFFGAPKRADCTSSRIDRFCWVDHSVSVSPRSWCIFQPRYEYDNTCHTSRQQFIISATSHQGHPSHFANRNHHHSLIASWFQESIIVTVYHLACLLISWHVFNQFWMPLHILSTAASDLTMSYHCCAIICIGYECQNVYSLSCVLWHLRHWTILHRSISGAVSRCLT